MSVLYEEDSTSWPTVNRTINMSDCMKLSKKMSVNNEQIAKLVKVKEHTKTWIKNIEKTHKARNTLLDQPVVSYDVVYGHERRGTMKETVTPTMYPHVLPVTYSCSFCRAPAGGAGVSQYHNTQAFPYVLLCETC